MSMGPERVAAFAWLVVEFCQEARPGELVLVEATPSTRAVALEVARALDHVGAVPVLDGDDHGYLPTSRYPDPLAMWQELTGYVSLRTVGDQLAARRGGAAGERSAPGRVPAGGAGPAGGAAAEAAVRTLRMTKRKTNTTWPDQALAARAGLTLPELEDYYSSLLYLDAPDPVVGFHALRAFQAELAQRLERARSVRIEGDGTDITLGVAGRRWVNSYGRRNVPSGEIYTSPLEDSAEGVIRFDVPSYNFPERVAGVELEFRAGELVRASAEEGEATLRAALARDAGARRLGELGIGGNRTMTRLLGATLFDEKVAGTAHLALGKSYPQTGGVNDSSLHWDLIKDLRSGGRILLDGEPFQVDGSFTDPSGVTTQPLGGNA